MKVDSRSVQIIFNKFEGVLKLYLIAFFSICTCYLISSVPESGQRYVRIPIYDQSHLFLNQDRGM